MARALLLIPPASVGEGTARGVLECNMHCILGHATAGPCLAYWQQQVSLYQLQTLSISLSLTHTLPGTTFPLDRFCSRILDGEVELADWWCISLLLVWHCGFLTPLSSVISSCHGRELIKWQTHHVWSPCYPTTIVPHNHGGGGRVTFYLNLFIVFIFIDSIRYPL